MLHLLWEWCYNALMKKLSTGVASEPTSEKKSWFSWSNDGPDANTCSLNIILDWIITPGNYSCFMGGVGGEM